MRKKFKIIDSETGEKVKLKDGQMIVMNSEGIFFIVHNFNDYDTTLFKLSYDVPKYDVVWKGEE